LQSAGANSLYRAKIRNPNGETRSNPEGPKSEEKDGGGLFGFGLHLESAVTDHSSLVTAFDIDCVIPLRVLLLK